MKRLLGVLVAVVMLVPASVRSDNTNVLIIPKGDGRAGAIFFVDECLTRGLTNTMSVGELRKWVSPVESKQATKGRIKLGHPLEKIVNVSGSCWEQIFRGLEWV